jgi:hypothetical protein
MNITTLHEAASIDAVVDRMFSGISAKDRGKVAAALIKANPKLEGLDRLDAGTVLVVPAVTGVKVQPTTGQEGNEDPVGEGTDFVSRAVNAYGAHLAQRHKLYQEQLKQHAALLKDRELKKALSDRPDAEELVPAIEAAIKTRTKEAAALHKEFEDAVKKLAKTLGSLGRVEDS